MYCGGDYPQGSSDFGCLLIIKMMPDVAAVVAPTPEPTERISLTRSIEICLVILLSAIILIFMFFVIYVLINTDVYVLEYSDHYAQEIEKLVSEMGKETQDQ